MTVGGSKIRLTRRPPQRGHIIRSERPASGMLRPRVQTSVSRLSSAAWSAPDVSSPGSALDLSRTVQPRAATTAVRALASGVGYGLSDMKLLRQVRRFGAVAIVESAVSAAPPAAGGVDDDASVTRGIGRHAALH